MDEEQRFEAKLQRDRQEMADREAKEREEAANKIKRAQQANQALIEARNKAVVESTKSRAGAKVNINSGFASREPTPPP